MKLAREASEVALSLWEADEETLSNRSNIIISTKTSCQNAIFDVAYNLSRALLEHLVWTFSRTVAFGEFCTSARKTSPRFLITNFWLSTMTDSKRSQVLIFFPCSVGLRSMHLAEAFCFSRSQVTKNPKWSQSA
mmetsp:Transcript_1758/g.2709  ORF Transcript_1758/g.2709 Transcript_1758/m.2709 type:complete len:134 (-) Transcript_1758:435-836(-)